MNKKSYMQPRTLRTVVVLEGAICTDSNINATAEHEPVVTQYKEIDNSSFGSGEGGTTLGGITFD